MSEEAQEVVETPVVEEPTQEPTNTETPTEGKEVTSLSDLEITPDISGFQKALRNTGKINIEEGVQEPEKEVVEPSEEPNKVTETDDEVFVFGEEELSRSDVEKIINEAKTPDELKDFEIEDDNLNELLENRLSELEPNREVETPHDDSFELTDEETVDILNQIGEATGITFNSLEDYNNFLADYKSLTAERDSKESVLKGLSDEERAIISSYRKYGDSSYYEKVNSIDVGSLSDKEALRQEYLLRESNKGRSITALNMKFEDEYRNQYQGEDLTDDQERQKKILLEDDARVARRELSKLKEGLSGLGDELKIETPDNTKELEEQMESQRRINEEWTQKTTQFLNEAKEGLDYKLDDDVVINLNYDSNDLQTIEEGMRDPVAMLSRLSEDENGKVQPDLVFQNLNKLIYMDKLIHMAYERGSIEREEKILKENRGVEETPRNQPSNVPISEDEVRRNIARGHFSD